MKRRGYCRAVAAVLLKVERLQPFAVAALYIVFKHKAPLGIAPVRYGQYLAFVSYLAKVYHLVAGVELYTLYAGRYPAHRRHGIGFKAYAHAKLCYEQRRIAGPLNRLYADYLVAGFKRGCLYLFRSCYVFAGRRALYVALPGEEQKLPFIKPVKAGCQPFTLFKLGYRVKVHGLAARLGFRYLVRTDGNEVSKIGEQLKLFIR